jgi:hypothetical protein
LELLECLERFLLFKIDERMKILAQKGEFANRKGIYPPLPGADKIRYVQMENLDAKAFEEEKGVRENIFTLRAKPES